MAWAGKNTIHSHEVRKDTRARADEPERRKKNALATSFLQGSAIHLRSLSFLSLPPFPFLKSATAIGTARRASLAAAPSFGRDISVSTGCAHHHFLRARLGRGGLDLLAFFPGRWPKLIPPDSRQIGSGALPAFSPRHPTGGPSISTSLGLKHPRLGTRRALQWETPSSRKDASKNQG